ncbi:MAG: YihY/virulence factor BrkB family protein, partial [Bacteroidota bacterium]
VQPDPDESGRAKIMHLVFKRLLSLLIIVATAILLVAALALSGIISAFSAQIADLLAPLGVPEVASLVLACAADAAFSLALIALLFAIMFKVLPDVNVRWKDVGFGAFVTAVLFVIGKLLIGWYMGQSNPGEAFGAAGALAAIMIFVYYASMILLLGAEFTQVWARRKGAGMEPSKHAVRVVEEKKPVRRSDGTTEQSSSAEHDGSRR